MKITDIRIWKAAYQSDARFICEISVESEYGAVKLKLDEERTQEIIGCVADLIAESGRHIATQLTKQALDHKAIEHKAEPPYGVELQ